MFGYFIVFFWVFFKNSSGGVGTIMFAIFCTGFAALGVATTLFERDGDVSFVFCWGYISLVVCQGGGDRVEFTRFKEGF